MLDTILQVSLEPATTSPAVVLHSEKGHVVQRESTAKVGKSLQTTEAPRLVPATEKQGDSDDSYLDELFQLMTKILYAVVQLNQNQSDIDKSQNNVSDNFVSLSKAQVKKAEEDLKKVLAAIRAAKHAGLFGKIFSAVASVVMIGLGVLTSDPALVVVGAAMVAMSAPLPNGNSVQDMINNKLATLSPGWQALAMTGMALAMAVVTGGASGGLTAWLTEDTAEAGSEVAQSTMSKVIQNGFTGGKVWGGNGLYFLAQSTLMFNPFVPAIQGILKDAGVSKDTAALVGQILGMVCAIVAIFATAKGSDTSLLNKPLTETGKKVVVGAAKYVSGLLQQMQIGASVTAGWFGWKASDAHKDQAKSVGDLGVVNGQITFYQALLSIFGTLMSQSNSSFGDVEKQFAEIGNRFDTFLSPYIHAAEVQG